MTFFFENVCARNKTLSVHHLSSKIQLCNSEDCRPLSNGEANINVLFRIEGSETSNSLCPKVILQMDADEFYHGWNTDGSTFYVGY